VPDPRFECVDLDFSEAVAIGSLVLEVLLDHRRRESLAGILIVYWLTLRQQASPLSPDERGRLRQFVQESSRALAHLYLTPVVH